MHSLVPFVLVVLVITNLISFSLMWYDKRSARKGAWRVKERTLFLARYVGVCLA